MKISKFFAGIFAVLAIAAAAAVIWVSVTGLNSTPVLLQASEDALGTVDILMNAVAEGDYNEAGTIMYGMPDLGVHEASDAVGQLMWDSFVSSISYELVGSFHATDAGLAQDVRITSLDMKAAAEKLGVYAESLLTERVEEAEDMSQVYDENNDYREDFVMSVLLDAAKKALEEDAVYHEQQITLNLVFKQGQWWIMPEQPLLSAISGGISG